MFMQRCESKNNNSFQTLETYGEMRSKFLDPKNALGGTYGRDQVSPCLKLFGFMKLVLNPQQRQNLAHMNHEAKFMLKKIVCS